MTTDPAERIVDRYSPYLCEKMILIFEQAQIGDVIDLDEGQYVVVKKSRYYIYLDRYLQIDSRCWRLARADFDELKFSLVMHGRYRKKGFRKLFNKHEFVR